MKPNQLNPQALDVMLDVLTGHGAGAIERQEKREQERSVANCMIARDFGYGERGAKGRAALTAAGVRFTGQGDDVLERVELPAGWKLEPTDHSMWSKLVDETGAERASCFYKGAFYDRRATVHVATRYRLQSDLSEDLDEHGNRHGRFTVVDARTSAVLFATEPGTLSYADDSYERHEKACVAYLDEHFPQWRDPGAYWGAP